MLFLSEFCFSQDSTFLKHWTDTTGVPPGFFNMGAISGIREGSVYTDTAITKDTIPVLIVVCDTSKPVAYFFMATDSIQHSPYSFTGHMVNVYSKPNPMVYWENGYEVRNKECCINGYHGDYGIYEATPFYTHVKYLDADKKELSKNIIVWLSEGINHF